MPKTTKAKAKGKAPTTDQKAKTEAIQGVMAMDAFRNLLARTGYGTTNLMEGTEYLLTRMTRDYATLNALYRSNWIVRRVIDIIPKAMLKNGWQYTCDLTPEEIDKLKRVESQTKLKRRILRGLKMGRLYGGAAGLILLEGQEDQLEEPLDLDSIMPGDFKGLMIVDRWQGISPQGQVITDFSDPEFGQPEFYQFQAPTNMQPVVSGNNPIYRVHHSRIVRFLGDDLPTWESQAEIYWGASKIESVYEELKKRDNTSANIAGLTFLANLRIMKIDGLDMLLGLGNEKSQQDFYNAMQAQSQLMSNMGTQVLGKDDDLTSLQYTFGGLGEIYETFKSDMAGACQIPVTKLFGTSPGGMNATGESDMEQFADVIEEEQEEHVRPVLEKLGPIISMSALGRIPDDLDYLFNPVRTTPDKERAEIMKSESEVIFGAHDRGIISDQLALKELKTMGEDSGTFSNLTDDDINAASDTVEKPDMMLGAAGNESEELDKLE